MVSTNHVYRLNLSDGSCMIAKSSSYGSYFLFREDHENLHRCAQLLRDTRFDGLLADVIEKNGRAFAWYDGREWVTFYEDVEKGEQLPRIIDRAQIENLATEMAELHLACTAIAGSLPPQSKSIKSDAIHLLELVSNPHTAKRFELDNAELAVVQRHCHDFLLELERARYDEWPRIPVLVDWNLGNFSVRREPDKRFRLFTRWDYDWFRIEPRTMDFYFLSRVSSSTGDRTHFTYSAHTFLEPRFLQFLQAYHSVFPLTPADLRFLQESYRFFILNYVIREGDAFFRPDLWRRLQKEAVHIYLPELDRFDHTPMLDAVFGK